MLALGFVAAVAVRALERDAARLPSATFVAGIPVGGLRLEEGVRRVRALARPQRQVVEVRLPDGGSIALRVDELQPMPQAREAIARASTTDSYWRRLRRGFGLPSSRTVPVRFRIAEAAAIAASRRIDRAVYRRPRSARLVISAQDVTVRSAVPGRDLDRAALTRRLAVLPAAVEAPVAVVAPPLATAAVAALEPQARRVVAAPVVVDGPGRGDVLLRPDELARLLRVERVQGGRARLAIRRARLERTLRRAFGGLERRGRPAGFVVRGKRVVIVPGRAGRRIDAAATALGVIDPPKRRTVPLRLAATRPVRTVADARRLRIRELVSAFRTPYMCCPPRVANIRRAVEILDGTIVPPGGRFSLNQVLGERTPARGFVPAPQINAGRLEDAVGGGVSQVATTVFNAAFFAGMRLDSFTPHEFWISRYPPGREATVSWGGPELVFTNDWPAGVLIRAQATRTGVTVRFYSSRLGRRVTTATSTPAGTTGGFPVSFTRRVYRKGRLLRDEHFTWTYRPAPAE